MDFFIKNERHRKLGFLFFVLYLVLLTYFLFFAEEMGRTPGIRAGYSYNLTPLKEIRRFLTHADVLGWRAVFLNIVGNMAAFMPFGFFLPEIWSRVDRWYTTTLLGAVFSLCIETTQLVFRVGSFDVDDLMINTLGACAGYLLGALGALLCVGMLCKLLYVPGGTYGCTVQQYGSLAFYFATCHELPQAIFELVRGSVSEQTLLTSLAMGCIGLCGLAAMLTTVPRSNPTKKDKAD